MEHDDDGDTNGGTGTGRLGNKRTSRNHPEHIRSARILRRFL